MGKKVRYSGSLVTPGHIRSVGVPKVLKFEIIRQILKDS